MARKQQIRVEQGTGRYVVENALPDQLDLFFKETVSELEQLLADEVSKQLTELKAAWPQPPSKYVVRVSGGERRRKLLIRTGKSGRAFRMHKREQGTDVVYTIQNDHKGKDGYSYVWAVNTYDFDMDGRKGRLTRAWHHFRDRAAIQVQTAVINRAGKLLGKGLKNG